MSRHVRNLNDKALDSTQEAFDALGCELFDPSGRHVKSVKDLVVHANMQLENLSLDPPPLASDATLEMVFGLEALENYNPHRMSGDLLNVLKCIEQELLQTRTAKASASTKRNVTNSHETSDIANRITEGRKQEHKLLIEEERREIAKLKGTLINGVKPTADAIVQKRIESRTSEARLLMQFFKFIVQQLAQNPKTDKYKLAMDLRGIREALGACVLPGENKPCPAADDIAALSRVVTVAAKAIPTPEAASSSRKTSAQAVPSSMPVLLQSDYGKDIITKKKDNQRVANPSNLSTGKLVPLNIAKRTSAKTTRCAAAKAPSTASSATHPMRGVKATVLIGDSIIASGGVLNVTSSDAPPATVSASKPITSAPEVVQHDSVGKKSMISISYPASSQNQVKILNPANGKMMVVEYAMDDCSKPTIFKAIHPAHGIRPTVASPNLRTLNPMVVKPVTAKLGKHSMVMVNERGLKPTLSRAINPVRASLFPQPNTSHGDTSTARLILPDAEQASTSTVAPVAKPTGIGNEQNKAQVKQEASSANVTLMSAPHANNGVSSQTACSSLIKLRPISELIDRRLSSNVGRKEAVKRNTRQALPTTLSMNRITKRRYQRSSVADGVGSLPGSKMINVGEKHVQSNEVMAPALGKVVLPVASADASVAVKSEPLLLAGKDWISKGSMKNGHYTEIIEIVDDDDDD